MKQAMQLPRQHFAVPLALGGAILLIVAAVAVTYQPRVTLQAPHAAANESRAPLSLRNEPIHPVPDRPDLEPALLALGRDLFNDPRLSVDGTIACASCHVIPAGGDDGRRVSIGVDGQVSKFNAPTVLNAALNFRQYWDGRARDLTTQAEGPLLNATEMGWDSWEALLNALRAQPDLIARFDAIFATGLTRETLTVALVAFEEWLLTPNAPFDRWLKGDDAALTPAALAGYGVFKDIGCIACHQGRNVGGSMFQRIGRVVASPFEGDPAHNGRFEQTGLERDRQRFKVPSLRNVSRTAPYLHDGSLDTLAEAIHFMAKHQLGQDISAEDVALIEAFLVSLEGELPPTEEL